MARASRDEWAERISQWRASGLTGGEFAARTGVNESTLRHWKWVLAHEKRRNGRGRATPAFVEIAGMVHSEEQFELVFVSGIRLRIPASFEDGSLRRILDILEGR